MAEQAPSDRDAPLDRISMQNINATLPKWDADAHNHLHAIVDMGSNGIRFSISDLTPPRARLLKCIYRERAAISLFDSLIEDMEAVEGATPTHIFAPSTVKEVSETISRFYAISTDHGVPPANFTVFATEAMRRAANSNAILAAIATAAPGVSVYILEPEVETVLGAMGARAGFVSVKGLFLDLGGGSVQVTYMDSSQEGYENTAATVGRSMPFGAARLSRDLAGKAKVKKATCESLKAEMKHKISDLCKRFPDLAEAALLDPKNPTKEGVDIYLCGGGFRGYGSMLMHCDPVAPYPIPHIGSYRVTGAHFRETKQMRKINADTKGKIFGMSKRRRAQFDAITSVIDALVEAVPNIYSVIFCSGGNREGALMMKLPPAIREENPLGILDTPLIRDSAEVRWAMAEIMRRSLPGSPTLTAPFTLGLIRLLVQRAWEGMGSDADSNASAALHEAVSRDLDYPGLTHQLRAALGLALWTRWGASLAAADRPLRDGLRDILGDMERFWAEYLGAVASALALLFPVLPMEVDWVKEVLDAEKSIKVHINAAVPGPVHDPVCGRPSTPKVEAQGEVILTWDLKPQLQVGLNPENAKECFKAVGKDIRHPYTAKMSLWGA